MDSQDNGNGVGAPTKFKEEFIKQAYKLTLLGAKNNELADFFEVDEGTIKNWKEKYPEFFTAIKRGKDDADATIAKSLFKRARGYSYEERVMEATSITAIDETGKLTEMPGTIIRITKKRQPPETAACIFWLKNRQPKYWRDKQDLDLSSGGQPFNLILGNAEPLKISENGHSNGVEK